MAICEVQWVQSLLHELGIELRHPPTIWCENISTTYLTTTPIFHSRLKHLEIDFHYVCDKVAKNELTVK